MNYFGLIPKALTALDTRNCSEWNYKLRELMVEQLGSSQGS